MVGTFLGLADTRFELSVNQSALDELEPDRGTKDPADRDPINPAALRVGGEVVIGNLPDACNTSVTVSGGSQANDLTERLGQLFYHLGLGEEFQQGGELVREAYQWLVLDQVDAGACVRPFSPGFDPKSADRLKRNGGIAVHANVDIANFLDTEFDFAVTPSQSLPIPNFDATARVNRFAFPGWDFDAQSLLLKLKHDEGELSATLGGQINVFGFKFAIDDPRTPELNDPLTATLGASESELFRIYPDGFAGELRSTAIKSSVAAACSRSGVTSACSSTLAPIRRLERSRSPAATWRSPVFY